ELFIEPKLPGSAKVTRLYEDHDKHPGALPFTAATFRDALKRGQNITFMMGHGTETSLGPLSGATGVAMLANATRPNVFITTECFAGRFDYNKQDSAAEEFIKQSVGGVAYIGSTNFGVGFPSFSLIMRKLTECLFAQPTSDKMLTLGACLQTTLRTYSNAKALHTQDNTDRWTQFVTVLLGDPSLRVWTNKPTPVQVDIDRPTCRSAKVTVTTPAGVPVSQAIITAFLPNELLLISPTDSQGHATLVGETCRFAEATLTVSGNAIIPQEIGPR
ncbi:MAG: hypothetical protein KAI47_20015, partial [Deltaproteobacteria bacterium]|nr:hypothetical protein [Deltaproteobacteria bacterium]